MSISSYCLKRLWFSAARSHNLKHVQKMLAIEPSLINASDSTGENIISLLMKENGFTREPRLCGIAPVRNALVERITIEVKKSAREIILDCAYTLKSNPETDIPYTETIKLYSDDDIKYLFFLAIKFRHHEEVTEIMQNHPYLINAQNNKGRTLPMIACFSEDKELIKIATKSDLLDLNVKDNMGFDTVFYLSRMIPYQVHLQHLSVYGITKRTLKYYQVRKGNLFMLFNFCVDGDFFSILHAHNHVVSKDQLI